MVAAVVAAIPACTDDHFDVRDNAGEEGANATQTIWEQIAAMPQLSKFATLVEKTPYFKDETHKISKADGTPYTFKDVLNGTQILTVFAPTNDAISESEYQELLGKCDTDPYDVYLRIVGNHITKNRYTATGTGDEKLVMVNGKKAYFSRDRKVVSGTQLSSATSSQLIPLTTANIPAVNGTLHVIDQQLPFHYNIYQYIKQHAEKFDSLRTWLLSQDTIYFVPSMSVENGSDENGNPVYVDSFYTRSNTLYSYRRGSTNGVEWLMDIKGFNGNIEQEDSVWAMILPTDDAWRDAWTTYSKYYNYASKYPNKYEQDSNSESTEEFVVNPDSIRNVALKMDLASMLLFNVRQQLRTPQHPSYWNAEEFNQTPMFKIFNTRRDTFTIAKQITVMKDTIPTTKWVVDSMADVKALLTDNASPITVSNGLVYPVNNWNFFKPFQSKDVEIKVDGYSIFQQTEKGNGMTEPEYHSFPSANCALATDSLLGYVSEDYFYKFSSTGDASVTFKIRDEDKDHDIMSNVKYRIGFVMVPDFYFWNNDYIVPNTKFKHKFTVSIKQLKGDKNGKVAENETDFRNKTFEYDGERVDTIWLQDSKTKEDIIYESQFSYKNLTRSYPTLTLKCSANPTDKNNGYSSDFCIDRIIFRAVDE